jgi:hypothetical protein
VQHPGDLFFVVPYDLGGWFLGEEVKNLISVDDAMGGWVRNGILFNKSGA